jgi:hypothetical protein
MGEVGSITLPHHVELAELRTQRGVELKQGRRRIHQYLVAVGYRTAAWSGIDGAHQCNRLSLAEVHETVVPDGWSIAHGHCPLLRFVIAC